MIPDADRFRSVRFLIKYILRIVWAIRLLKCFFIDTAWEPDSLLCSASMMMQGSIRIFIPSLTAPNKTGDSLLPACSAA